MMNAAKEQPVTIIVNKTQLVIGLVALCLGTLVYLVLRQPDQVYFTRFFGIHAPLFEIHSRSLHTLGRSLPAFLHIFSFILITASFFRPGKTAYAVICAGWLLIDCLFELGQKYKTLAAKPILDIFDGIPFLESTRNFFLLGTFDIFDLLAFALGTVAAYLVLTVTSR